MRTIPTVESLDPGWCSACGAFSVPTEWEPEEGFCRACYLCSREYPMPAAEPAAVDAAQRIGASR